MPSLKVALRKDVVNTDGKANIKIRISHHRAGDIKGKTRYICTPYYIEPRYLGDDGLIKTTYPGHVSLNGSLTLQLHEYNKKIAAMGPDVVYMDISTLVARLKATGAPGSSFSSYMKRRIEELRQESRHGYADSYRYTLWHLESYTRRDDIRFGEITAAFLKGFEAHLRHDLALRVNTVRIYLNNIRAVFYHAIDAEIIAGDISPFRKFKIAQEKTRPRPLDIKDLRKLISLRDKLTRQQLRAVDLFFLSFYLCGINFKDLLYLRPADLVKGRIEYSRFKTGRAYSVKVLPEAKKIIDRYPGERYLLNLMDTKEKISPGRMSEAAHDILSQENKLLKTIARVYKLPFRFSTYSARYSWATIAAGIGISRDIIAHALGHGIDTMTDIYIDFDLGKVDQANRKVINSIR
jgi:integrase